MAEVRPRGPLTSVQPDGELPYILEAADEMGCR
jgi:hypothetical protein